jgi:hypothetical protein
LEKLERYMRLKNIRSVFAYGLVVMSTATHALEADVGRATVTLFGENWQSVADEKQEGNVTGAEARSFDIKQKTWVLTDGSKKVKAILRIRGTTSGAGGNNSVVFQNGCKKIDNPDVYTNDYTGGSLSQLDCLRIYHIPQSSGLLNQVFKVEQAYAVSKGLNLPVRGTFLSNAVSMSTGTFLDVSLFADQDWTGIPATSNEGIPATIKPEVVAWATAMAKAARGSVRSFSGKMAMPAFEFKP